ncbi:MULTISPECIES: methyltransferase, FxLD system [unclassified Nonomuraea]|uniref:methyltransferase, FxLD system n=1 Tax=unclassified Nonomuraea TaxID=2593643 RepID=UPI00191C3B2D|nr:methyltransferase, FxLD system [Nonomuraea sp. KC401]
MTTDNDVQDAAELRDAMVRELRDQGAIRSEAVAAAVAAVPRHVFTPGETLQTAYAPDHAPIVKAGPNGGRHLSVVSAAHLQATMLEAAEIEPGMRVIEYGSGGYNAALAAELVGNRGHVTTVDIDPDIVARARTFLDEAGYHHVNVMLGDAEQGVPGADPFDRVIGTAGFWDIPPAWLEQLADDGRIVVPLRFKGTTRWIVFERYRSGLVSRAYGLCSFVPVQGAGSHTERTITIDDGVVVCLDDESLSVDADALRRALHLPRIERWSGAVFDMPDEQMLFLLTNDADMALLYADQTIVDLELLTPSTLKGVPVLIRGDSFAYRAARPNADMSSGYESGVYAHGPAAEDLAARYAELLRRWADKHYRRGAASIRYIRSPPTRRSSPREWWRSGTGPSSSPGLKPPGSQGKSADLPWRAPGNPAHPNKGGTVMTTRAPGSTATLAPSEPERKDTDGWDADWLADLDVSIVESGVAAEQLIRMTDDGCNSTCGTACVSCK